MSATARTQPEFLLASARYWPLAARMGLALLRQGCTVDVLCPAHHPLEFLTGLRCHHRYAGLDSLGSLRRAIEASGDCTIVPCDDDVVQQLHALHAGVPHLRPVIEHSLGAAAGYPYIERPGRLLAMARTLGLPVPDTVILEDEDALRAWRCAADPTGVLKINGRCGGQGVRIFHSPAQALTAWRELTEPVGFGTALKRWAIDCDTVALWSRRQRRREMTVQQYVPGQPANSMFACRDGRLLGIVSVAVVAAEHATGAAVVARIIRNAQMTRNAGVLAQHLRLSGFYGLDYIIDAAGGVPLMLELNPRCTQLGHLEFAGGMSLARLYCEALRGRSPDVAWEPDEERRIAFFPQALAAGDRCSALVAASRLDRPDDARLLEELRRPPWPRRHALARLYYALRQAEGPQPALFEGPAAHGASAP